MIEIRNANKEDFDFYYSLKSEKTAIYWSGFDHAPDKGNMEDFWKKNVVNHSGNRDILILSDNGIDVGYSQITHGGEELEYAMGVCEEYRGMNYGGKLIKETAKLYPGTTMISYVREDNIASQRCLEKNGFIRIMNYTDDSNDNKFKSYKYMYRGE